MYADKMAELNLKAAKIRKWARRIKKTGLSRAKFCEDAGFDPGRLSKWINGRETPHWSSIQAVEDALNDRGV